MTSAYARWSRLGILLIVLLAFGLRLHAIDRQDIWGDEAFSIWLSSQPFAEVVAGGADTHPPLYPLFLYLGIRLAGSSPMAVRSLSAFIGTLIVPAVYVLGRRAIRPALDNRARDEGWLGATLAALLVAVSPVLVYYSQETRMYGLVTLFSALLVYGAMRTFQEPDSLRVWAVYALCALAAAYTHYYAFFVILGVNLVVVFFLLFRRQWALFGRWLAVQIGIGLAYVPWILVQRGFLSGKASGRLNELDLSTALRIAGETIQAFGAGLAVPTTVANLIALLFVLAAIVGLLVVIRRHQMGSWLVGAYLLVPILLAWAVNPIMPFFFARYLLLIAPAYYLLVAWGVLALARIWKPLSVAGAVLLLSVSGFGLSSYYTDQTYVKGRYGQMMTYIEENAQPGDGLLLANQLQRPIYQYYQPDGFEEVFYYLPRYEYPLEDPRTAQGLEEVAARHPRLWLVRFGNPMEYDPDDTLTRWLATHGSKAYYDGWVDADLSLYVMSPAAEDDSIQHSMRVDLGDRIQLLGYALGAEEITPGGTLLLTIYWQALAPVESRYTVFTHLLDASDQIQAQMDSEPQGGGMPTDRWPVGQIIQDNFALTVSADSVPGTHVLEVGMYLLETLERVPVYDPVSGAALGDRILLGTIEVVAP